jgi:hypothetical protein
VQVLRKIPRRHVGLAILTLAYPLTHFAVSHIPNPLVPSASIALNMVFPVLAGYFFGTASGAFAGGVGTGLSALIGDDVYDALAVLPHTLMGAAAGGAGKRRLVFLAVLSLAFGHILNIFFYWRFDQLRISRVDTLFLGLAAETTVGAVAVVLLIVLLHRHWYCDGGSRW